MAKDYTKYQVEGLEGQYSKARLVQAVIQDYIKKNNPTLEQLITAFPDSLQGGKGVIAKRDEIEKERYFYVKEAITLSDGAQIAIGNQWGKGNINNFIEKAKGLGFSIKEASIPTAKVEEQASFNLAQLSVRDFKKLIRSTEDKKSLEPSLLRQARLNIDFWSYLLIYDHMVNDGVMELSDQLSDDADDAFLVEWYDFEEGELSLCQFVLDKLELDFEEVQSNKESRILYTASFGSYLYFSLANLACEIGYPELASFIASNDHRFLNDGEDVFDQYSVGEDWIVSMTDEWLMYCGFDSSDYEGDLELRMLNGDYEEFSINYEAMAEDVIARFE